MSLFAIGDLHLSISNDVDKPMDIYGPRWAGHMENLEKKWQATVKVEDTVIIPGDVSWGLKLSEAEPDLAWIDSLPGRKLIFKGNHDLWWNGITRINKMFETITFVQNKAVACEGAYICGTRGWITPDNDEYTEADDRIYKRECLRLELSLQEAALMQQEKQGEIIGVLHYPPVSKINSFSGFQQLFMDYGVRRVIYGHVHGEEGFRNTIKGNYHGTDYNLVSYDYLMGQPLKLL